MQINIISYVSIIFQGLYYDWNSGEYLHLCMHVSLIRVLHLSRKVS